MNYKNYLKEQLLSEIILPRRDFDPNLLSPKMKLKMGSKKGPDRNIISGLKNLKFQPTKWEQEMRDRPLPGKFTYGTPSQQMMQQKYKKKNNLSLGYVNPNKDLFRY
jgi:hypothetical protein